MLSVTAAQEGREEGRSCCQFAFRMAFVVVLILVSLPLLDAGNETTLDDVFLENGNEGLHAFTIRLMDHYGRLWALVEDNKSPYAFPYTEEVSEYLKAIQLSILTEFARAFAEVPVKSIYDDLNEHCSEYGKTEIEEFTVKLRNTSCVQIRLAKIMTSKLKMAVEAGLQQLSNACIRKEVPFCSAANRSCTLAHEERMGQILIDYVEDWNNEHVVRYETLLGGIKDFLLRDVVFLIPIYTDIGGLRNVIYLNISSLSVTPFKIENVLRPLINKVIKETATKKVNDTVSENQSTWGIKTNTGKLDLPCSNFREKYPRKSDQFFNFLSVCYFRNLFRSNSELMRCAYSDPDTPPLKWSTVSSVYFHSECLCLAFKGRECRVKAPQDEDPRFYCLSVFLRDLQRRVSYRPAITYLDYAFQTKVPVCKFSTFLHVYFQSECNFTEFSSLIRRINIVPLIQCYFKDLVDKHLDCSETLLVDNLNHTTLCDLIEFMSLVLCDDETDEDVRVNYYGAGDSTLVLVLTYVDVTVRVLTLVTYLVCSDLRNLPGKLLIAYQVTALVRLLVVRAGLEDLQMAVRLDVAMDLSSTLWLTSYLHFLTVSIETLRLPDSLSPDEVRMVLLRYSLFGWALTTALSAVFFFMDEAIDSRVQFGQVSFVLCNCVALFANIYMFFKNCHFYYDVNSRARMLLKGVTARSVFTGLFNFAMKTAVLSGAGITLRLIFTQFHGLQNLLGFYHALGTVQGMLIFFLYGCSRQARVFWFGVFRSTLGHCRRRHNTSPP